jgi:S1-C subfamily serine protease
VQQSLGSGVIIDGAKALVLTNAHVIAGASSIKAKLLDGREFDAELVGAAADFDIAVLHLKGAAKLPQVEMAEAKDILIGETVIAIGNPYGFTHTVTTGVVSALHRSIRTENAVYTDFIQTDAAINPGNSGGPLLNILGQLIGVNTAIKAGAEGIGFAIPVDKAKRVVAQLLKQGEVSPVWLGFAGQDLDQRTAAYFGLRAVKGLLLTEVYERSPAEAAGLTPGDLLLSLNGAEVDDGDHYLQLVRSLVPGDEATLTIVRGDRRMTLVVRAERFTEAIAGGLAMRRWGFALDSRGGRNGLLVTDVRPGGPAARIGMSKGDHVASVGSVRLSSYTDFLQAVTHYSMSNTLLMVVTRQGRAYTVRMTL